MKKTSLLILTTTLYLFIISTNCLAQNNEQANPNSQQPRNEAQTNELAIAHLNHCIESLSKVITYKNRVVLMEEYYSIINNLTVEQLVGFSEIGEYRKLMLEKLNELIINETERDRVQRLTERKMKRVMMESVSNAIDQPWIAVNSFSTIITAAKTVAQAAIDYNIKTEEIEEMADQQMWEITKQDMRYLTQLRVQAIDISLKLFEKHNLKESMRITESDMEYLSQILQEKDNEKKLRMLETKKESLQILPSYWYYLGDALIKNNKISKGLEAYAVYQQKYKATPLFRKDKISGLIALDILEYKKELSIQQKIELISVVEKNLPDNGGAMIACALYAFENINDPIKGVNLLIKCIDNNTITAKDEAITLLSIYIDKYKNNQRLLQVVQNSIANASSLEVNTYISFILNTANKVDMNQLWKGLDNIEVKANFSNDWFGDGYSMKDKFTITIPSRFRMDANWLGVLLETKDNENIKIASPDFFFTNTINKKDILSKVDALKKNEEELEYFFQKYPDDRLMFRSEIDLSNCEEGVGIPSSISISYEEAKYLKENWSNQKKNNSAAIIECDLVPLLSIVIDYAKKHPILYLDDKLISVFGENKRSDSPIKGDITAYNIDIKNGKLPYRVFRSKNDNHQYELKLVFGNGDKSLPYVMSYVCIENGGERHFKLSSVQYIDAIYYRK